MSSSGRRWTPLPRSDVSQPGPSASPVGFGSRRLGDAGHIPGTSCRHLPRDDENRWVRNRRSRLVRGASSQVGPTRDLDPAYRPTCLHQQAVASNTCPSRSVSVLGRHPRIPAMSGGEEEPVHIGYLAVSNGTCDPNHHQHLMGGTSWTLHSGWASY